MTGTDAETDPETVAELDAETVERIAAGEVVTRPESAVRELIENALDAGATRIDVAVDGDGTDRIRVADDGRGMSRADAALAVERHTTSKVRNAADVERADTLGFRGEALPSVAEVATLELTTNDGGPRGTRVVVADGEKRVEPAGRARGTTVEVRDLFADRPVRRESLSGTAAEFGRISDAVAGYALANPEVRFSLAHDGRETFATQGSGSYADAALGVYDREVASHSTEFDHETTVGGTDASDGDGGVDAIAEEYPLRVEGVLAYPSETRATRDHVRVAVDGRPLADAALRRAVVEGYGSLLPSGRAPVAAVSVSLPPAAVDQNVHPAKRAVAFRDEDAVTAAVETAASDALATADLRRSAEVAMDLDAALDPAEPESAGAFDDASVIGQYRGLYLLCEADDDLLVIDQHAAHERVNYERLRAAVGDDPVESAPVSPPETFTLSPPVAAAADEHAETLARAGFELEAFGGRTYRLAGVPAPLGRTADADALRDALDALRAGEDLADARDAALKDLACHPSLKAGDDLSIQTATDLVERLGACDQPYACPHGRPTVVSIAEADLARGFERGGTRLD